ncbi:MAG TPA: hypothetical protein VGQ96_05490 [Candidatus Eremiobacteraceae bacterium]|nr:hypothetical protein [Candidatus Eremiobacteraceae bacterium]
MHTRTFRPYALFLLCAVALLPGIAVATQPIPPVATKISGSVSVLTPDGARHEVIASKILHSGDVVSTGPNSLAQVELADVGRVIVGPSSATSARTTGTSLSLQISSGLLCLQ